MLEVDDQARNLKIRRNTSIGADLLLNVFPNPSNSTVNFNSESSVNGEVKIIDAFGRTVFIKRLNNGNLSINNLNSGVYFAGLLQNNNVQSMIKFIVIK